MLPFPPLFFYTISHNPTATPNTAAATTAPIPIVTLSPAPSCLCTSLACATCSPYAVDVATTPLTVVVTTLVAVVLAVHALQLVHGADVLHGPAVQPGQSDGGHLSPSHQAVHGPERQSERVDQSLYGPKLELPQGPGPLGPVGEGLVIWEVG